MHLLPNLFYQQYQCVSEHHYSAGTNTVDNSSGNSTQ